MQGLNIAIKGKNSQRYGGKQKMAKAWRIFTKGRLCQVNLISSYNRITDFLDKDNAVNIIYLELSKADDTLPQGKLLV